MKRTGNRLWLAVVAALRTTAGNFYLATFSVFFLWMLFFDQNGWITQVQRTMELRKVQAQRDYYLQKIAEVKQQRQELMGTDALVEKFARERYFMKKPSEEIFLVEDEEDVAQQLR